MKTWVWSGDTGSKIESVLSCLTCNIWKAGKSAREQSEAKWWVAVDMS